MENTPSAQTTSVTHHHRGSCHCGAVRFEATVNVFEGAGKCNCSICLKVSNIGAVTKPEAFTLIQGEGSLSEYAWGGKTATRYFCKHCGMHPFYMPRSDPDKIDVNARCLEGIDVDALSIKQFDGRHWEDAIQTKVPWR